MPDAPKWTVTEWADDCHPGRWFVRRDNSWYSLVVGSRTWSGFGTLAELQEAHPRLRPVNVDKVDALLADFDRLDAEYAKTVSNFEEHAEATADQLADARHEIEVLRGIAADLQQRLDLALTDLGRAIGELDQSRRQSDDLTRQLAAARNQQVRRLGHDG